MVLRSVSRPVWDRHVSIPFFSPHSSSWLQSFRRDVYKRQPQYHQNKLKFIQLSKVDDHQILAVIVAEGNVIRNKPVSYTHLEGGQEPIFLQCTHVDVHEERFSG